MMEKKLVCGTWSQRRKNFKASEYQLNKQLANETVKILTGQDNCI